MKPKEYVEKYRLKKTIRFNHADFKDDIAADFEALTKTHFPPGRSESEGDETRFRNVVHEIRDKFDAVFNGTGVSIRVRDGLWSWIYAVVVCPARDSIFPDGFKRKGDGNA